jgi:hypothetical protein
MSEARSAEFSWFTVGRASGAPGNLRGVPFFCSFSWASKKMNEIKKEWIPACAGMTKNKADLPPRSAEIFNGVV